MLQQITKYEDILMIKHNNYVIVPKYFGTNIILNFTIIDDFPICIDNNNKIYHIRVDKDYYNGTSFEGILLENKFIIIDSKIIKGENINQLTYLARYDIIKDITNTIVPDKYINDIELFLIQYYNINEIPLLQEKLNNSKYIINELLFIDNNNNTNYFFSLSNNKIHNEIIKKLRLEKTHIIDVYNVFDNDSNLGIAFIPNLHISLKCQELFNKNSFINVNCKFNTKFNKWTPLL